MTRVFGSAGKGDSENRGCPELVAGMPGKTSLKKHLIHLVLSRVPFKSGV